MITRNPIRWPDGARVAVWVIPNIEHFEFETPLTGFGSAVGKVPDVRNYSWKDYGNRVGLWRIMRILDKYDIKATVALNAAVCDHYPVIIEQCKQRDWEFMGHGITNSKSLIDLPEAEEREVIRTTIRKITDAVDRRPEGWLSPALAETFNTPDILAEEGIIYLCDWCNDDQPYPMKVRKGSLVSIPYSIEINDMQVFINYHLTTEEYCQMIKDQFDVLYEEGATNGQVMAIAVHPFLTGLPYRIGYLDRALQYIKGHKDVWFATGSEITSWYLEHSP
jgi:peptidoglycan/xylan/chitin deacetylase (PgdA/CDA1 family)